MNILEQLLDLMGQKKLLRSALSQPEDLMQCVRLIHERTFLKLTGKRPLNITGIKTCDEASRQAGYRQSLYRRVVRRGL